MPQVFKVGSYWVYFWTNEGEPLEPIHVHINEGAPSEHATKIWLTKAGKALLCHNRSKIPEIMLRRLMRLIESRSAEIQKKWLDYFGEIRYFC